MQSVHKTYVVPALKSNNIAVFTVMWLPIPSLHAVKTWSQKKESNPCVMRQDNLRLSLNVILARAAALEDGRVQVGQRGQEASLGKEGRKEGRKK